MKEEAGPSRQCRAGLVSRRTYEAYLSCPKVGVDLCTHLPEPSKFTEALVGFSHICIHMVSRTCYSLKVVFLERLLVWEEWVECTFPGKGKQ